MNPFEMQAKLTKAWFDAATAGLAVASRGFNPWVSPSAPTAFSAFWEPLAPPTSVSPWPWLTYGQPSAANWWQAPFPFATLDWTRAFQFAHPATVWPMPYRTWADYFPGLTPFSMYSRPKSVQEAALEPMMSMVSETTAFFASYRTASGHATAAILRAMDPRAGQTRTMPWTPMTLAMPWL